MQITTDQLAAHLDMNKQTVWLILKFMVEQGKASVVGKIRAAGKGRPSHVYEVPDSFTFDFTQVPTVEYELKEGAQYLTVVEN